MTNHSPHCVCQICRADRRDERPKIASKPKTTNSAVFGTFDGSRWKDLRDFIPEPIKDYYKREGTWDSIVRCRFHEHSDVIWVKKTSHHGTYYRKHKWGYSEDRRTRIIVDSQVEEKLP